MNILYLIFAIICLSITTLGLFYMVKIYIEIFNSKRPAEVNFNLVNQSYLTLMLIGIFVGISLSLFNNNKLSNRAFELAMYPFVCLLANGIVFSILEAILNRKYK